MHFLVLSDEKLTLSLLLFIVLIACFLFPIYWSGDLSSLIWTSYLNTQAQAAENAAVADNQLTPSSVLKGEAQLRGLHISKEVRLEFSTNDYMMDIISRDFEIFHKHINFKFDYFVLSSSIFCWFGFQIASLSTPFYLFIASWIVKWFLFHLTRRSWRDHKLLKGRKEQLLLRGEWLQL